MKAKYIIISIISLLALSSCGDKFLFHDSFFPVIKNDSGHTISAYFQIALSMPTYPDTTIVQEGFIWSRTRFPSGAYIKSWELTSRYISKEKAMREMIRELSPSDTVSLFVFHSDTLDKYDWKTVMEKYLIIVRYDLTADYFLQHDTVWFPPTVEMRDVKMWPPYEEVVAQYNK